MKRCFKTCLALALMAATGMAYAEPSAHSLQTAQKIVELQVGELKPMLADMNKSLQLKIAMEPDADKREMLKKVFGDQVFTEEDMQAINASMAKTMAKEMSDSELDQVYAFLNSPAGRKYSGLSEQMKKDVMPTILQIIGRKFAAAGTQK